MPCPAHERDTINAPSVFISYTRSQTDSAWASKILAHLEAAGCKVFRDVDKLQPGDDYIQRLDEVIATCSHAIFIISEASADSAWVQAEYRALMPRSKDQKVRVIPLLLGGELPSLLVTTHYIDLRERYSPSDVDRALAEVLRAVLGERSAVKVEDLRDVHHPDMVRRPEGPHRITVRVDSRHTEVATWQSTATWTPTAWEPALSDDLLELARAGARPANREHLDECLAALGQTLADSFLGGPAGELLASELAEADRENAVARVSLEVSQELDRLPWEALRLPGRDRPLALEPRVQLYRTISGLGKTALPNVPGPLRVLAVIASPEDGGDPKRGRPGADLLDYEAELGKMLDALGDVRKEGVSVRILEWGSASTIRQALQQERFHVLHISCHVTAAGLMLEDEEGRPDQVDAARFVDDIMVPDRGVPLIVLARCSATRSDRSSTFPGSASSPDEFASVLESFARGLLERGVPAVIGMTQPVSDRYAVQFTERFYQSLADRSDAPDPLSALSDARRQVEIARNAASSDDDREAEPGQWHVPILFLRGSPRPLYDISASAAAPARERTRRNRGFGVRQVNDMVGRRTELRFLLALMRSEQPAVLIRGLGGVGKTTVAERLAGTFTKETGHVVAVAEGRVTPTEILSQVARALSSLARNRLEDDPLKRAVGELRNVQMPWRDQMDLIEDEVLPEVRVTLILDEAEQNLHDDNLPPGQDDPDAPGPPQTLDPEFGDFLANWLDLMPRARLIITSRAGLPLPPSASGLLTQYPLGPLSRAEAVKLMWRLPGIDALGRAEQARAYVDVGGHPRALEYLDSLLRGDRPRNQNVLDRMERALRRGGVEKPEQWIRTPGRSLDEALAGAVTLISSDVLLDRLLVGLRGRPAHDLFALSSVYRQAVDDIGLNWVMTPGSVAADSERAARLRDAFDRLDAAQRSGHGLVLDHLGLDPTLRNQLVRDIAEGTRPADHPGLTEAIHELVERNLLSVTGPPEAQRYLVHRWTALGLQQLVQSGAAGHLGVEDLEEAHRRAAAFHEWRAGLWRTTVTDLLEARYHHHAAGDFGPAAVATAGAGAVLYRWGEFDHVMRLCQETLGWIGSGPEAIELLYLQSLVAGRRENWDDSRRLAYNCLELADQAGDRRWTVMCELQLGVLAQETGDHSEAERHFNTARDIAHEVGDVALIGLCYSRLGALELARHHEEQGLFWSRGAVGPLLRRMPHADLVARGFDELRDLAAALGESEMSARLGRRAARQRETDRDLQRVAAEALQQFGEVNLRRERLDHAKADYTSALEFAVQLEDRLLEMDCYLGLGRIAQLGGQLMTARQYYRDYLDIADTLRNRIGTVQCYRFLGDLAKATGDRPRVQRWYGRALELATKIGDDRLVAQVHLGLGRAHREVGEHAAAKEEYRKAEEISRRLGDSAQGLVVEILLDQGASASEQGNLDEAERLYREARSPADWTGDFLSVVKANLGLAAVSRARGYPADARSLAERALTRAEEQGHPRLVCDAVLELGLIEEAVDNPQEAAQLYRHGLNKAKELGESRLMIDFSLRLGDLADGTDAFDWYDQALEWLEQLGDLAQAARLRVIIGRAALLVYDDIPRAQADFTRALQLLGTEEASTDAVEARLGLARAALAENNAEAAGTWFGAALPLADELGVVDLQAQSYQGLGVVAQLGDDLEVASQFHTRVTQLTGAAGASRAAMEARRDLARLAWRTGRLDDAMAGYETALGFAEAMPAGFVDAIACAQQIAVICDQLAELASEDERGRLTARAAELRERFPEVIRYPLDMTQTEAAAAVATSRAQIGAALTAAGRPDEAVGFTGASLLYQLLQQREDADRQLDVLRRQQQALGERIRPIMTSILTATGTQLLLEQV